MTNKLIIKVFSFPNYQNNKALKYQEFQKI
jgi:hypothetical protein